jgi:hypothetical protein
VLLTERSEVDSEGPAPAGGLRRAAPTIALNPSPSLAAAVGSADGTQSLRGAL